MGASLVTTDDTGLFDVAELAPLRNAGRAEAGVMAALRAAEAAELIQDVDGGLVAGVLIAARALDRAEALPDKSAVYAIAQLIPPFQKALHGLRLPAEVAAVGGPPSPVPAPEASGAPDWLGDVLGPS